MLPIRRKLNVRRIRWASQIGFLLIFLSLTVGAVCVWVVGKNVAIAEPLGMLQLIFTQALNPHFSFPFLTTPIVIGLALFIGGTILLGRAFCAWVCPIGTVVDGADLAFKKLKIKPYFARHAREDDSIGVVRNRFNKYAVLAFALTGSAAFKFPVWCVFCPIGAICRGAASGVELAVGAELLTVPAVGCMGLGEKRFWCRYLCPVGGLLTIISRFNPFIKPRLQPDAGHKNCGVCTIICPEGINVCNEKETFARCTKCYDCINKCPWGIVEMRLT